VSFCLILSHLSSGDLLRAESEAGTDLGKQAKELMREGKLVPDDLIFEIIDKTISKPECNRIMFDGFPRTLEQAKQLDEMLKNKQKKLVALIYLNVPDSELIERGTGRRIHVSSRRSYHIKFKPPKVEGKDDITGEDLIQRDDDKEETIKKRLEIFHANNDKILDYYENQKLVFRIEANDDIDKVWTRVEEVLERVLTPENVVEPKKTAREEENKGEEKQSEEKQEGEKQEGEKQDGEKAEENS